MKHVSIWKNAERPDPPMRNIYPRREQRDTERRYHFYLIFIKLMWDYTCREESSSKLWQFLMTFLQNKKTFKTRSHIEQIVKGPRHTVNSNYDCM